MFKKFILSLQLDIQNTPVVGEHIQLHLKNIILYYGKNTS